ncbi:response regulator [Bacteroides clarus]
MKTLGILLICLIVSASGHLCGNEIFKQLTIEDRLAHTDANCIAQDSTGLIWIGTYAGLQSYDGYSLQTFNYYSPEDRIFRSHNRINSMACTQDKLWVGSESGLTCFDLVTHSYIPYYIKEEAKDAFDSSISRVFLAPDNRYLWFRTDKDIHATQIHNDTITPLRWNSEEERLFGKSLEHLQFQGENIWSTNGSHIVQLTVRNGKIHILNAYQSSRLLGTNESIQNIYVLYDFLYIRTTSGCYRVSVGNDKLYASTLAYTNFHAVNARIPVYTEGKFTVSKEGTLWCAYAEGIFEVQYPFSENPSIREYLRNSRNNNLSAQRIADLQIDNYNNLWVATSSWGIFHRTLSKSFFKNISRPDFRELGFSQNEISSVAVQEDGIIWMIVEYASLFRYDPQTEALSLIPLPKDNSRTVYYQNLEISRNQRHLYIGTSRGILIYDLHTRHAVPLIPASTSDAQKLSGSVSDLQEDTFGRLWVGGWGNGLTCVEHPLTAPRIAFQLKTESDPAILSNQVSQLLIKGQTVFIATTNGLNRLVLTNTGSIKTLSAYQVNPASPATSMSTNYLASIDCNNDSVCWAGTIGGGLNKIALHSDRNNDYTATCYTTQDGLTNNDCEIVLTDYSGNVWIGGNGIAQLDLTKDKIYMYGFADGLQNNAFKVNVSYKGKDGTLYMGGLHGLSYFLPEHLTHNTGVYTLALTGMTVNNRPVTPNTAYNAHIILEKILDKTSALTLNHLQNNFSISFAALGYEISEQIMYRYRLQGFQSEWTTLRYNNNEIFFSNLPYGTYKLEVQLSTDRGYTWQEPGKRLEIEILPPWWWSGWAKTLYALIVMLGIYIALHHYNKEQNLKKENEIQKILIAQDEEKYQSKMQFFMNASHELKTPLTLILLAAEKMREHSGAENKEQHSILHNARKMLKLITELVDIRKQDLGIATLRLQPIDLSQITRQLFDEISPWAENKQIAITYTATEETITLDADINKIGKMILNLFSNAVKYTNEGGRIDISLKTGARDDIIPQYGTVHAEGTTDPAQPLCILTVRDTGVGISSESIQLIYERFFQVNDKAQDHLGSGIGLAIVKSTVLQHKGMIIVSSERNRGSEFIVALPIHHALSGTQPTPEQLTDAEEFISEQYNEFYPEEQPEQTEASIETPADKSNLPTLLIVEDNKELQTALKERLSASYNVHVADNGRIGLETCLSIFPDIIVSDVMMPEMDGVEMCRHIKNNLSVAYIPVVMLTAKDNVESQIEGYESGADLYIPKPFSMKLLEVNLQRLLKQREQWFKDCGKPAKPAAESSPAATEGNAEKGKPASDGTHQKSSLNPEDLQEMTEKLKQIIDDNLSNPNLSPDQLAAALGISRTKLYRDLKRVDGQSLSDYVRNARLEKAAYLLVNTNMNIQEVMNEVGFVNNSHFTKIFKLKYDVPPTEYKKEGK